MPLTTLNLMIRRHTDGTHWVDMELRSDQSAAVSQLASQCPLELNTEALRALSGDQVQYGRLLAAQLFADPKLHQAWRTARDYAATGDLQLRLHLDPFDPDLHTIHWEMLSDPERADPLALHQRVRLVRTLASPDLTPVRLRPRPDLWALVLVANPRDLARFDLTEVDVDGEVARTRAALGDIRLRILADHPDAVGRATLANLLTHLGDAPPLVLLIAHGSLHNRQPLLWLEQEDGTTHSVEGAALVDGVARLPARPLLLALLSCESAGRGYTDTLQALGPALAQIGVPAVLGFQGNVAMSTVKVLLPALIREVRRDGQIDRALAAARTALGPDQPWWQATLWLRTDGRLWVAETRNTKRPIYDPHPGFAPKSRIIGREGLVAQIRERLTAHPAARVALIGIPGVGKSRLANALFHDAALRDHFQGGILCATLGETPMLELEISRWFGAIFPNEDARSWSIERQAERLRQHLAADAQPWLCILDDLWAAEDLATFQALIAVPTLLITTRQQDVIDQLGAAIHPQEEIFTVPKLQHLDAVTLLREHAGITSSEYDGELGDLATLTGDLPLSFTIGGVRGGAPARRARPSHYRDEARPRSSRYRHLP
ncbi:hypothetical protein OSCT_1053 [Oscillochloris trichoides DG-6]|uniref:CHAT domain-containing protein n=1 Tax=Oscillochloris trichoides DG-6 TaxID=765420 RepID=E1ICK2_9CHLR|nr:CHAT domain-containing protein [Oscillochloris trichoides]EFO81089.1 hypothetical protein OSCT_1053 [Oscillochloris trichoides DG-6]